MDWPGIATCQQTVTTDTTGTTDITITTVNTVTTDITIPTVTTVAGWGGEPWLQLSVPGPVAGASRARYIPGPRPHQSGYSRRRSCGRVNFFFYQARKSSQVPVGNLTAQFW